MASASTSSGDPNRFWSSTPSTSTSTIPLTSSIGKVKLNISKVSQLDSNLLDRELEFILFTPILAALQALKVQGSTTYEPELVALLRFVILKLSLYDSSTTYGTNLQNLLFISTSKGSNSQLRKSQKISYIILQILPSYLYTKLYSHLLSNSYSDYPLPRSIFSLFDLRRLNSKRRERLGEEDGRLGEEWKRVLFELLGFGEKVLEAGRLGGFLWFLFDGKYRSLTSRLLSMRLIYSKSTINRNVSFEFLNRQLVWEAFTEFLLFMLPLLSLHSLRLKFSRYLLQSNSKFLRTILSALPISVLRGLKLPVRQILPSTSSSESKKDGNLKEKDSKGVLHFLPLSTCPICYSNSTSSPLLAASTSSPSTNTTSTSTPTDNKITNPYSTNCSQKCQYCYYDILSQLIKIEEEGELNWICLRCGDEVTAIEKVVGSVDEEVPEEEEAVVEELEEGDSDEDIEEGEEVESEVEGSEIGSIHSVGSQQDKWR